MIRPDMEYACVSGMSFWALDMKGDLDPGLWDPDRVQCVRSAVSGRDGNGIVVFGCHIGYNDFIYRYVEDSNETFHRNSTE